MTPDTTFRAFRRGALWPSLWPRLTLWLVATMMTGAAHAAESKSKATDKILTPAQLRDCLAQQTKVKQQDAESLKQRDALAMEKAEIDRQGEALQAQLATLDRTNAEAVAAYNAQAQARDKRIDLYQVSVDQYNVKVTSLTADHDAFAKSCDNRRFLEDDETAIKKGK